MSLLYGLITQDYSTEIPWEGLQQTAVCYKRPFTKTSHRESNMLSYEDDKAPPIKHVHAQRGSLGCSQCWPFMERAWVFQKFIHHTAPLVNAFS